MFLSIYIRLNNDSFTETVSKNTVYFKHFQRYLMEDKVVSLLHIFYSYFRNYNLPTNLNQHSMHFVKRLLGLALVVAATLKNRRQHSVASSPPPPQLRAAAPLPVGARTSEVTLGEYAEVPRNVYQSVAPLSSEGGSSDATGSVYGELQLSTTTV